MALCTDIFQRGAFLWLPNTSFVKITAIPDFDTDYIATFNIRIFSNNSRDDEERLQICNILKEFDFIAIQEGRDTEVLDRTVLMLKDQFNLDYRYLASKKVGTERVKEIYAYLYRTDKVTLIWDQRIVDSKALRPSPI